MLSNILSKFPVGFTPSAKQNSTLVQIEQAYNEGYKYVICNAPTGSGKSFISKTLGNASNTASQEFKELVMSYKAFEQALGSYSYEDECLAEPAFGTFALTITKALQDQYSNLFEDSSVLKGKSNYVCEVDANFSVETAPCVLTPKIKDDCCSCNKCPYYNARNTSLVDQFSILNYKMFLSLPGHVKRKNYIVCDEASELEDELVKQFTLFIDPDKLKILGLKAPLLYAVEPHNIHAWVNQVSEALHDCISELTVALNEKKVKVTVGDKLKLSYFKNLHSTVKLIIETWEQCEYICHREGKTVKLTPLRVNALSKYIFNYADKVLLMSATIIDHKNFAKTLGIDNYKFIDVESTFDPAKAPIYLSTKYKLNRANLERNLPMITQQIKQLCENHKDVKGIIHTHTMQITQYLQKNLKGDRFLFRSSDQKNEQILTQHIESDEPTILVSPSMTFGVDLKDDLARFQIIVKASYLPLNDTRIKKLFDEDKVWYTDKMLCNFVQACGRGNRTVDDHCVTYVLDGVLYDIVLANKAKLPKHFIDRFV